MMIFSVQVSAATALVAALGAILLAAGLRNATFFVLAPAELNSSSFGTEEAGIFAQALNRAPREAHGYVIAISLYAAACALMDRRNLTAAALLALSAFLFAWKRTFARSRDVDSSQEYKRAARRLALVAIPAILVTIWALLDGVAHRNRVAEMNAALAAGDGASANEHTQKKSQPQASASAISGYESIILWPIPEKKQILPPLLAPTSLLAPGTTKPLIIRFDGAYWYFQPPEQRPSATAHQAHGTPLAIDIQSHNFIPLTMEAHQNLRAPIRLARCREIQVTLQNRDLRPGVINSPSCSPIPPRPVNPRSTSASNRSSPASPANSPQLRPNPPGPALRHSRTRKNPQLRPDNRDVPGGWRAFRQRPQNRHPAISAAAPLTPCGLCRVKNKNRTLTGCGAPN